MVNKHYQYTDSELDSGITRCPFQFGDEMCGWRGCVEITTCDQTFGRCVVLGNTRRFGGHPVPQPMLAEARRERDMWRTAQKDADA